MTSVDAVVSYHGQRQRGHDRLTTTASPRINRLPHDDDDDDHGDDGTRRQRQRQRPARRRIQSVLLAYNSPKNTASNSVNDNTSSVMY